MHCSFPRFQPGENAKQQCNIPDLPVNFASSKDELHQSLLFHHGASGYEEVGALTAFLGENSLFRMAKKLGYLSLESRYSVRHWCVFVQWFCVPCE